MGERLSNQIIGLHEHTVHVTHTSLSERNTSTGESHIRDSSIGADASVRECSQLSSNIRFFPNKRLSKHALVYEGEQISGVFGALPIVVKLITPIETGKEEARILLKLNQNPHSHVISIIQSDKYSDWCNDYVYIALEKCHSDTIQQFVLTRKNKKISFDSKIMLEFCRQLNSGVEYIHDKNIIHKDLKPDNIFLSLDQSKIKIADFGLSQEMESASEKISCSAHFGTKGYRAPETFGGPAISQKTDVFSLGVILYFLLSNGEHPFGGVPEKWNSNIKNSVEIDLSHLLVPNVETTQHLIKCSIEHKLDWRPTIREVINHPCWTGKDVECHFDYRSEDPLPIHSSPSDSQPSPEFCSREEYEQLVSFVREMRRLGNFISTCEEDPRSDNGDFVSPTTRRKIDLYSKDETSSGSDSQATMPEAVEDESRNFLQKVTLAGSYILAGTDAKAIEVIDDVRRSLLSTKSMSTADDVKVIAESMKEKALLAPPVILFRIASDMYKNNLSSPDEKVESISSCLAKCGGVTKRVLMKGDDRSRKIAEKYGLKYMNEMLEDLRSVKDASSILRTLKEAGCLDWIASSYYEVQKSELSLELRHEAVDLMEREFGSSVCEYKVYGHLFHNIGAVHYLVGRKKEAVPYLEKAIELQEKALDFESEFRKRDAVEWSKMRLITAQTPGDMKSAAARDYSPVI